MIQVKLNELERNQALAALDYRSGALNGTFKELQSQPQSESRDAAIDIVVEALHWTNQARLALSDADAEWHPVPELEMRALWGDR